MSYSSIIWIDENTAHFAEHGLTPEDVDAMFASPVGTGESRSSGEPALFGYTPSGRYVIVVYSEIDDDTVYPITGYDVEEPS